MTAQFDEALLDVTQPPISWPPDKPLAMVADLPDGRGLLLEVAGLRLFLHRWAGGVVGYVNRCPHIGTPLDLAPGRFLSADGSSFICATHSAKFDPATGLCTKGPCVGRRLQPVAIICHDGAIMPARRL